jgi:hypothetical protein
VQTYKKGVVKISEKIYKLKLLFGENEKDKINQILCEDYPFKEKEIWEEI